MHVGGIGECHTGTYGGRAEEGASVLRGWSAQGGEGCAPESRAYVEDHHLIPSPPDYLAFKHCSPTQTIPPPLQIHQTTS